MDMQEAKQQVQLAASLYQNRQYEQCLTVLEEVSQLFPNDKKVMYNRALCLAKLGRLIDATCCCDVLEGHLPKEHIEALRKAIAAHQTPVPQAPVIEEQSESETHPKTATPTPLGTPAPAAGKRTGPRFDLKPLATLAPEGPWPLLLEWGYLEAEEGTAPIPGAALLAESRVLNEDGWRCFVALINRLLERVERKNWHTAPNIPDTIVKSSLSQYERVFVAGELVVAVREAKHPIMLSDRHLYCMRAGEELLPTAVSWNRVEAVESLPSGRERILQIRLRNGQRIPMDLKGMAEIAAPFMEFLNEVSLLYEAAGTSLVILPLKTETFQVPEYCCNCLSREVSKTAGFVVKDPSAPLVPQARNDGDDEEKGRLGKLSRGVTSLVGRAFRRGEGSWDDGVQVYVSSDPGVTFKSCPYCASETPVRICRVGDLFKVFVFQNKNYAKRFKRANEPGFPSE